MNQEKLLRRMVKERASLSDMAAALGVGTDTVRTRLRELRLNTGYLRKSITIAAMKAAYEKAGGNCAVAAQALGCTRQAVHSRLLAAGVIAKSEKQPA